jgi:hypothetical protein
MIAGKRNLRFTLSKNDYQDSALNRPRPNVHPSSPTPPIVVENGSASLYHKNPLSLL